MGCRRGGEIVVSTIIPKMKQRGLYPDDPSVHYSCCWSCPANDVLTTYMKSPAFFTLDEVHVPAYSRFCGLVKKRIGYYSRELNAPLSTRIGVCCSHAYVYDAQ